MSFSSIIKMLLKVVLLLVIIATVSVADTPADCKFEKILGKWTLFEGTRNHNSSIDCTKKPKSVRSRKIELKAPNVVIDEFGNKGTWTMIYNQAFELTVDYRVYFAFSNWEQKGGKFISRCNETKPGWAHNIYTKDWSCFYGVKDKGNKDINIRSIPDETSVIDQLKSRQFRVNYEFIDQINKAQNSWTAGSNHQWEKYNLFEVQQLLGGLKSSKAFPALQHGPAPQLSSSLQREIDNLPKQFDWRNHNGQNFVSPVRHQNCGNCYAFGSTGMMEARFRVATNNTFKPVFSTQDITECCQYSHGCKGGFAYLVAGKYAADYGLVLEECNPKPQKDGACNTNATCQRYFVADYSYIGGYYGAKINHTEPLMRLALVKDGPIAVGISVYQCHGLLYYKDGIFQRTDTRDKLNEIDDGENADVKFFEPVNHSVVVVGYGHNETTGHDYWIVKNSWGLSFGDNGYFNVRRGNDECGIESMVVEAFPILN